MYCWISWLNFREATEEKEREKSFRFFFYPYTHTFISGQGLHERCDDTTSDGLTQKLSGQGRQEKLVRKGLFTVYHEAQPNKQTNIITAGREGTLSDLSKSSRGPSIGLRSQVSTWIR